MSPPAPEGTAALDDSTSVFVRARPRLFGIAYRKGSSVEAEDVVRDVATPHSPRSTTSDLEAARQLIEF